MNLNEKIRILVADDNKEFGDTLVSYLEKEENFEVVGIARDGNQAVDEITMMKPDIVLLDIIMPHLDGLGVLEKLNESNMENKPMLYYFICSWTR